MPTPPLRPITLDLIELVHTISGYPVDVEADAAYRRAIDLTGFGDVAEIAMKGRSRIAQSGLRADVAGRLRMDAVMYCMSAIERFAGMSTADVNAVVREVSLIGRTGLEGNNPDQRYELASMPGDYSGLQLVCILYVGTQEIAPGTEIGFDLAREYEAARGMITDSQS